MGAPLQMEYQDKVLKCIDCGTDFVFTAGEQLFFHDKQFRNCLLYTSDVYKRQVVVVLVVIVLALFGQYVGVRNQLVAKDQGVKAAWSQVDIVLQRRADLIPNLVETVKGYAQQEVTVFGDIAKAVSYTHLDVYKRQR